jgi:ligand-binding sensor domain-containing protein
MCGGRFASLTRPVDSSSPAGKIAGNGPKSSYGEIETEIENEGRALLLNLDLILDLVLLISTRPIDICRSSSYIRLELASNGSLRGITTLRVLRSRPMSHSLPPLYSVRTAGGRRKSLPHGCAHLVCVFLALIGLTQTSFPQTDSIRFDEASPPFPTTLGGDMLQDHYGYLWFVTSQQCFKFDGYTYSRLYGGTSLFPGGSNIGGIAGGRHEFVCVYAIANALFLYDIDRNIGRDVPVTRTAPERYGWLNCVIEDSSGRFWLGCDNGEVLRLNPHDSDFVTVLGRADTTVSLPQVTSIAEDSSGNIWIGGDGGLLRIPHAVAVLENPPATFDTVRGLPCNRIVALLAGRDGRLWVGMRDGSFGWIEAGGMGFHRIRQLSLPEGPFGVLVWLAEDHNGALWVATPGNGLYRWDSREERWGEHLVHTDGSGRKQADVITSLMVDRSGILWVMTNSRGLLRHMPPRQAFRSITAVADSRPRLSGPDVLSCWMDRAGSLWVGRNSGGLDYLKAGSEKVGRFVHDPSDPRSISSNYVLSICERRNGELWFGTVGGGINVLERDRRAFHRLTHDPHNTKSPGSDIITALYEDSHSGVWVGHFYGVDRFDPARKVFVLVMRWPEETLGLVGSACTFLEDSRDNLWMGTVDRGLIRINRASGDTIRYLHEPGKAGSLPCNVVKEIYEDPLGRLWIGNSLGVARFDYATGSFENYDLRLPGLLRSLNPRTPPQHMQEVVGILADRRGDLWLSLSDGGVAWFDVQHRQLRRYGECDGVVVREGRRNAFFMTREGVIYDGGTGGITWFHPDSIRDDGFRAQVAVTQFRVLQEPRLVPTAGSAPIVLDYWANTFTFEFAILDYRNPGENQCSYTLEGADPDWAFAGRERTVTYANVPPGEYRFRVRGMNSDGVPGANEAIVAIIVGRPYWHTWWFRFLLLLAVCGVLYALYRYRIAKFMELQRLRLRIADDLHDDIGSELSGIALESELIARQLPAGTPQHTRLVNVGRSIRKASDNLRDVVWIVNPELDKVPDLVTRLQGIATKMLAGHRVSFQTSGSAEQCTLGMEQKRHIVMMFKEILNNIVRHARASHVQIEVDVTEAHLRLKVSDDGVGFSLPSRSPGFGIAGLHTRAAAIGGTITLESTPSAGTRVCLEASILHSDD